MSVIYRKRPKWHAVATAITASTTPPADALITLAAAPSDTAGIHIPDHVGEDVIIRAELTTAGGSPSMTVRVFGYTRTYTAQDGTLDTYFGATSTGRWVHIADLNGGTAVTAADHPWAVPAANTLTWDEPIRVGSQYERLHIQLWASGGTTPTLNTFVAWGGGE